jgi:hypothetical protein
MAKRTGRAELFIVDSRVKIFALKYLRDIPGILYDNQVLKFAGGKSHTFLNHSGL